MARSKSESIIANALYSHHIPYRYECELHFGDITLYPDFTIMHPDTHELFYWEHFGMMDHKKYVSKTFNKLNLYIENEIIPSVSLLTTYETANHPLDATLVEQMILHYFL